MYCRQCGTLNDSGAPTCIACGAAMPLPPGASPSGDSTQSHSGNPYSAPVASGLPPALAAVPSAPPHGKPPNYLVQAILVTFCCCLPFGVAAIVYAAQVDSKWSMGDYHGAALSSAEAKKWTYLSLGIGLLVQGGPILFYFGLIVVAVLAGAA